MTDAEIIKALECFAIDKDFDCSRCVGCAFETKGLCCENCSDGIAKASLDLINRQKAEIKAKEDTVQHIAKERQLYYNEWQMAKAEIEKLKGYVTPVASLVNAYEIETAKAEAIKEFAERLKNRLTEYPECYFSERVTSTDIDNLVKEMVGADNAN